MELFLIHLREIIMNSVEILQNAQKKFQFLREIRENVSKISCS